MVVGFSACAIPGPPPQRLTPPPPPLPAWLAGCARGPPAHRAGAATQFHSITLTQAIGLFCGEKSNFLSQSV
ncbi:hypothetical protein VZT92_026855 [Zoarces viviparus]|uniref:Uncharacterized protein n=1 Tax=Zoarces viviparus TaxID=48416 RepID=A0AAW1DSE5_ZOAVI